MDFIELTEQEVKELFAELGAVQEAYGLRKLRVSVDGERVKFKVNEQCWSAPMGSKGQPY